jgi:hypothetical protein
MMIGWFDIAVPKDVKISEVLGKARPSRAQREQGEAAE